MTDLKKSTKKALFWSAVDKGGQQLLSVLIGITTTRLLMPEAFGLVGTLMLFTAIANILSEGGLAVALIRKTNAGERDYNTMFWFNLVCSVFFYAILFFAAPLIAQFYRQPELTGIARVQFLTGIIFIFGMIQSTLLVKRGNFKALAVANIVPILLGGVTVIALALSGFGVWALVAQRLAETLSRTVILWATTRWIPRWSFSRESFREMFGFSSKLVLGSLVNSVSNNFYTSFIGRYFPIVQVGYYDRANKMKEMGASSVSYIFGNSIYLMLSNLQDEMERFRHALRKAMRTIAFIAFPLMLGLAVIARPLVELLITDTWLPSVPYLQILCLGSVFYIFNYQSSNVLKVKGRSDLTLGMDVLNAGLLILFLFLTFRFGLLTAIVSDALSKLIVYVVYMILLHRQIGYRWRDQLRDIGPYALLGVAMAALIWPLQQMIHSNLGLVAAQILVGAGFYLGTSRLLGSKVLHEVIETLKFRNK